MTPETNSSCLEAEDFGSTQYALRGMNAVDVDRRLIQPLNPKERQATLDPSGYAEATAGRYMTPDFVELSCDMTVAQTMERIRRQAFQKKTIYYSYVIDDERHLLGVVSLRELVIAST